MSRAASEGFRWRKPPFIANPYRYPFWSTAYAVPFAIVTGISTGARVSDRHAHSPVSTSTAVTCPSCEPTTTRQSATAAPFRCPNSNPDFSQTRS